MRTGRPRTRTAVVSPRTRAAIARISYGNVGAFRARHLPSVSMDEYYSALRGEKVHPRTAQLIENQALTVAEK